MNKIGILWQTAVIRPAQEHFMSNLIRQKIIVAIDGQISVRHTESKRFMLFLPEREIHELSLLFMNYILRARGFHTLYLGASVPFGDVEETFKDYLPHYLLTLCVSYPGESNVQSYISNLSAKFPIAQIIVSGRQALSAEVNVPANVMLCETIQQAIAYITNTKTDHFTKNSPAVSGILLPAL